MNDKERIARRVALEFHDGDVVNLGIGMPTLAANYVPKDVNIILQSENGILGMDSIADEANRDSNIVNAGGVHVTVKKGASFFDSAMSFAILRGGHVDVAVLGALQVDEKGNLANHIIPGKLVPGMGGAMDLIVGARKVVIAMTHTAKGGPKILKRITLPATALGKVNLIVTEMAVIEVSREGLVLKEINPDYTIDDLTNVTEAPLIISDKLKSIKL